MTTPVSLQMWVLLVAIIGVPVHVAVNKGLSHWREHGELSSILTMTLVMLVTTHQLLFSTVAGLLFGTPIGLIFRAMVHGSAPKKSPSRPCSAAS